MEWIQHFSHRHRLLLNDEYEHIIKCAACRDYLSGNVYSCNDCRYYLHKECAELEREIKHSLHPFQSLKLHGFETTGCSYHCNMCQNYRRGFSYHCTDCNFEVDLLCSFKSEISLSIHDHKLKLQVGDTDTEPSFFAISVILDVTVIEDGAYIVKRIVISRSILTVLECL